MLKDLFFIFKRVLDKKKAREVVINAEVISHYTGIHSIDVIKEIHQKTGGKNEYLRKILRMYAQEKPKHEIYGLVFDSEFVQFLKVAEAKHVPVSSLFKDYQEVSERVNKAKKKITSAIVRPLVLFFIAAVIVYWALGNILTKMGSMKGLDLSTVQMIHEHYWFFTLSIPAFILTALFKFPRKVPFLSGAFKELDAFQYLAFCSMLMTMGIPSTEIVKLFKSVMKAKITKEGMEGLVEFFKRFLKEEETIVIAVAAKTYEYERVFKSLLERRKMEFDVKIEAISATLGEMLVAVVMLPVVVLMFAIMTIMSGISQMLAF
jgi:type II secretory pathway component PulF